MDTPAGSQGLSLQARNCYLHSCSQARLGAGCAPLSADAPSECQCDSEGSLRCEKDFFPTRDFLKQYLGRVFAKSIF